jgi:hypothetical protein
MRRQRRTIKGRGAMRLPHPIDAAADRVQDDRTNRTPEERSMRLLILILTLALLGVALPAFAECGGDHQASDSATTTTSGAPPSASNSGG